jgi:hypothetical protein
MWVKAMKTKQIKKQKEANKMEMNTKKEEERYIVFIYLVTNHQLHYLRTSSKGKCGEDEHN